MKKIINISLVTIVSLILASCGNNVTKEAMLLSENAIKDKNYDKALSALSIVIDNDKDNKEAIIIKEIIIGYNSANEKLANNDLSGAKQSIDKIDKKYVNYAIKDDIDSLKKKINSKIEFNKNFEEKVSNLNKLYDEKSFNKCNEIIATFKENELNSEQIQIFETIKLKIEQEKNKIAEEKAIQDENNRKKKVTISKRSEYLQKMDQIIAKELEMYNYYTDEEAFIMGYELWDDLLNEIWGVLKQTLPKNEMKNLTSTQIEWIKYKEKNIAISIDAGASRGLTLSQAAATTEKRCRELVELYIK